MTPPKDPMHWLYRLSAIEWLAAAETELRHASDALNRRAYRPGVTHARRAAGMAWNAALVENLDTRYGRSYMEHVTVLAEDDHAPVEARQAARYLCDTRPVAPELVQLGKPDLGPLQAARVLIDYARARALRTN